MDADRRRRLVQCVAFVVLCAPACIGFAADERAQPARDWQAWLGAVKTHVPGTRDEAVAQLGVWSLAELESAVRPLSREPAADQLALIERALVLHSDIAILNRVPDGYTLPPGQTTTVLFNDGRAVGQTGGTVHWEFARRLLDGTPRGSERLHLGRRFYRATGAVLQFWGENPELTTHLAAGRRLLGDDPMLLLYEGTQHQAYAGPRTQRFFDELRASATERRPPPATPGSPTALREPLSARPIPPPSAIDARAQADRLFRRALAIDSTLVEARIRLAHILSDVNRHDEAASELEAATRAPLPPLLDYYASLLVGRVQRARGQFDAARAGFERARTIYPGAPAPRLGLSELAMARRDRTRSLEQLLIGASATYGEVTEPWWSIERDHEPSAQTLIADMRRSLR